MNTGEFAGAMAEIVRHRTVAGARDAIVHTLVRCGAEHVQVWLAGDGEAIFVDQEGHGTVLVLPMWVDGDDVGALVVRVGEPLAGFQHVHLQAFADHGAAVIVNARAFEQAALAVAKPVPNRPQAATTARHDRLTCEIHDAIALGFTGVIAQLEAAADAVSRGLPDESDRHVARAREFAREGLMEARRAVQALRPRETDDPRQLAPMLKSLVRKLTAGTRLLVDVVVSGEPRALPAEWEDNLLWVVQEAVTNASRHAQARHIDVRIAFLGQGLSLDMSDDGGGFDPRARQEGCGLTGMRERVKSMGGRMAMASAPGEGASIRITLPFEHGLAFD